MKTVITIDGSKVTIEDFDGTHVEECSIPSLAWNYALHWLLERVNARQVFPKPQLEVVAGPTRVLDA